MVHHLHYRTLFKLKSFIECNNDVEKISSSLCKDLLNFSSS